MKILDSGIEINGVNKNINITNEYFKEFDFQFNSTIEKDNPNIESILSANISNKILSLDIIKTPIMLSNEGVYLSGYKLKVEVIFYIKIKYNTMPPYRVIGLNNNSIIKTVYIVLPLEKNGDNMIDLLRRNKIVINSYIEDFFCEATSLNNIYHNISAIITADFLN